MIKLLYVLSALAMVAAGCVLVLCADQWSRSGNTATEFFAQAGAVQVFAQSVGKTPEDQEKRISPLTAQAQAFASYLNPPPAPVKETPVVQEAPKPVVPEVRPGDVSAKLKLLGTSYFADEPKRSMALIWEPGATDSGRWVKEGMQVGHVTIHEIRPGSIVCMAGEKLCEMAVERQANRGTAVAGSSPLPAQSPQTAMNDPRPASPAGRPRRPTGSAGPTVGSARTAALD